MGTLLRKGIRRRFVEGFILGACWLGVSISTVTATPWDDFWLMRKSSGAAWSEGVRPLNSDVTLSGFGNDSFGQPLDQTYTFDFCMEGTYYYLGKNEQILIYSPTSGESGWEIIDKRGNSYKRTRPPQMFNPTGFVASYKGGSGWGKSEKPIPTEIALPPARRAEAQTITQGVSFSGGRFRAGD